MYKVHIAWGRQVANIYKSFSAKVKKINYQSNVPFLIPEVLFVAMLSSRINVFATSSFSFLTCTGKINEIATVNINIYTKQVTKNAVHFPSYLEHILEPCRCQQAWA